MSCRNAVMRWLCGSNLDLDPEKERARPSSGTATGSSNAKARAAVDVLETLHDPETPEIDIVAIHGLGGHPHSTWTAYNNDPGESSLWLRDFLPGDLPNARVMSYGYDSDFFFTRSTSGITDFALRLLGQMRAVRSGGAEKALILANEKPLYLEILKSTYGIVFMGTPHLGSDIAGRGNSMFRILKMVVSTSSFGVNVKKRLRKGLRSNSRELWDITLSFRSRTEDINKIITCIEQQAVPGSTTVVDFPSATLNIHNETVLRMHADHMNMCKFSSPMDEKYVDLSRVLRDLSRDAASAREEEIDEEMRMTLYKNERYEQCLESLGANSDDHSALVPEPHAGTCDWILSNQMYIEWISSESPSCLYLSGAPGTGKSVMSKFFIKNLEEKPKAERPLVASFFYSFDGVISVLDSLRRILHQIIQQDPTLLDHRMMSTRKFPIGCWDGPAGGPLWRFLKIVLGAVTKPLFIIIDGVDLLTEKDRGKLLHELMSSVQNNEHISSLRVLITGRPLQEVALKVEETPGMWHLPMDVKGVRQDIRKFVSYEIREFEKRTGREFVVNERDEIRDSILKGAESMFLWASLAWSAFTGARGPGEADMWGPSDWEPDAIKSRLEQLRELPQELGVMYSRLASAIDERFQKYAKQILGILLAASRPLTIGELRVLVFQRDHGATPEYVRRQLVKICGEFVSIQEDNTVRLMHPSVAEFLMLLRPIEDRSNIESHKPEWYNFEHTTAHRGLGVSCLMYLATVWKPEGLLKPDDGATGEFAKNRLECERGLEEAFGTYHLLEYASLNWAYHVMAGKETGQWPEFTMFMNSGLALNCSFQIYWLYNEPGAFPGDVTPLHILSYFGFSDFIRDLGTASPENVHATDTSGRTPLHWAAERGEHKAVQELLKINAGVNPVGERDAPSPLHLAASCGHKEVVKLLLLHGADLNIMDREFGTPLQAAAYRGHEEVVKRLLLQGANPNITNEKFGTALQAAAYRGHEELVKRLLLQGANPNITNEKFGTPLQAAAYSGRREIVALLLDGGADPNAQTGEFGSALQAAATYGRVEAVEMLLGRGAEVTARGGKSESALQAAARGGHSEVLKLLLSTTARISAQSDVLDSARKIAAGGGYTEAACYLKQVMDRSGFGVKRAGAMP